MIASAPAAAALFAELERRGWERRSPAELVATPRVAVNLWEARRLAAQTPAEAGDWYVPGMDVEQARDACKASPPTADPFTVYDDFPTAPFEDARLLLNEHGLVGRLTYTVENGEFAREYYPASEDDVYVVYGSEYFVLKDARDLRACVRMYWGVAAWFAAQEHIDGVFGDEADQEGDEEGPVPPLSALEDPFNPGRRDAYGGCAVPFEDRAAFRAFLAREWDDARIAGGEERPEHHFNVCAGYSSAVRTVECIEAHEDTTLRRRFGAPAVADKVVLRCRV